MTHLPPKAPTAAEQIIMSFHDGIMKDVCALAAIGLTILTIFLFCSA